MPERRPYASRGVPRRVTTRPSDGVLRVVGLATLITVLGAVALAVVWIAHPFSPNAPPPVAPSAALAHTTLTEFPGGSAGEADAPLRMVDVSTPPAIAPANEQGTPNPTPTSVPTVRQWDSGGTGVTADATLVRRLDQVLAGVDGHLSVAIKDLGSGRGAVLDGGSELAAASLYKLPVLYTVFDVGLSMTEALPITEDARAYDAGTLELGVGETLTVAEALERMVSISDNTAAVMLGSRVGGQRVNATMAALGLETTHYGLERMTTSSVDMLHLLELVARGKAVSAAASADMVHLLLRQRVNDRLPRLLPDDVQVAHKTGNLPGTVNDVGILYGPSSTVLVAALISDTTDEAAAATSIARAAQVAYTYFDAQPEVSGRPTVPLAPARAIPPVWREPRPVLPTPTPTVEPTASAPAQAAVGTAPSATSNVPPTLRPTQAPAVNGPATQTPTATPTLTPTPSPTPTATPSPTRTPTPTPRPATLGPTAVSARR